MKTYAVSKLGSETSLLRQCFHLVRLFAFLTLSCAALFAAGCETRTHVTKSIYRPAAESRLQALAGGSGTELIRSLTELPPSLCEDLRGVADANEPFCPGCTGSEPHQRFLAASKTANTYHVAVEHGGVAYTWFITEHVLDKSGKIVHAARINREN